MIDNLDDSEFDLEFFDKEHQILFSRPENSIPFLEEEELSVSNGL